MSLLILQLLRETTRLHSEDVILVNNGSTAVTVTLPTAVGNEGKKYHIKLLGTANLTIDPNGSETIDGSTTLVVTLQYDAPAIISDGSNWNLI
jgi:hypothetical protein